MDQQIPSAIYSMITIKDLWHYWKNLNTLVHLLRCFVTLHAKISASYLKNYLCKFFKINSFFGRGKLLPVLKITNVKLEVDLGCLAICFYAVHYRQVYSTWRCEDGRNVTCKHFLWCYNFTFENQIFQVLIKMN